MKSPISNNALQYFLRAKRIGGIMRSLQVTLVDEVDEAFQEARIRGGRLAKRVVVVTERLTGAVQSLRKPGRPVTVFNLQRCLGEDYPAYSELVQRYGPDHRACREVVTAVRAKFDIEVKMRQLGQMEVADTSPSVLPVPIKAANTLAKLCSSNVALANEVVKLGLEQLFQKLAEVEASLTSYEAEPVVTSTAVPQQPSIGLSPLQTAAAKSRKPF